MASSLNIKYHSKLLEINLYFTNISNIQREITERHLLRAE